MTKIKRKVYYLDIIPSLEFRPGIISVEETIERYKDYLSPQQIEQLKENDNKVSSK